uniref:Uncharacterized protein n=1 Tax=Aquila chrysaetos chrysaetos TaxID=223781 RepID=A0A663EKF9_AQUCH
PPAPAFRGSLAGRHPPHQIHAVLQPQQRASPAAVSPQRRATAALFARSPRQRKAGVANCCNGTEDASKARAARERGPPRHLKKSNLLPPMNSPHKKRSQNFTGKG